MWTPDVRVRRGPDLDVVEGVSGILPERWGALCSVCGSSRGVVLRCSAGHCTLPFHALCGRNAGFYLAARGAEAAMPFPWACRSCNDIVLVHHFDSLAAIRDLWEYSGDIELRLPRDMTRLDSRACLAP